MSKLLSRGISAAILVGLGSGLFQMRQELRYYYGLREVYLPSLSEIRTFSPGQELDEFYVRCMVDRPMYLQWRYSLPAGTQFRFHRQGQGGAGYSSIGTRRGNAPGGREVKDCQWTINLVDDNLAYFKSASGSGGSEGGYDPQLAKFLSDHWHELEIEVAGRNKTETFKLSQVATLLKISFPAAVLAKAKQEFTDGEFEMLSSPLIICIGPEACEEWKSLELAPIPSRK